MKIHKFLRKFLETLFSKIHAVVTRVKVLNLFFWQL